VDKKMLNQKQQLIKTPLDLALAVCEYARGIIKDSPSSLAANAWSLAKKQTVCEMLGICRKNRSRLIGFIEKRYILIVFCIHANCYT
jgi:hypothetical protein